MYLESVTQTLGVYHDPYLTSRNRNLRPGLHASRSPVDSLPLLTTESIMTSHILSRIVIEVHIPNGKEPNSDEAWIAGDWEVKLDKVRDSVELAARSAAPAGTTITID